MFSCFSGIGRKYWDTGSTRISLGNHCVNKPIVIHEVLHALGMKKYFTQYSINKRANLKQISTHEYLAGTREIKQNPLHTIQQLIFRI